MLDEKLRKSIQQYAEDNDLEITLLTDHSYDNSIIGISYDGRLIYDYEKMIEEFMEDEECDYLEAEEWLEYNTIRAIPYFDNPPIIMNCNREFIEQYDE